MLTEALGKPEFLINTQENKTEIQHEKMVELILPSCQSENEEGLGSVGGSAAAPTGSRSKRASCCAVLCWCRSGGENQGRAGGTTRTHSTAMEMGEKAGITSSTDLQGEQKATTAEEPVNT